MATLRKRLAHGVITINLLLAYNLQAPLSKILYYIFFNYRIFQMSVIFKMYFCMITITFGHFIVNILFTKSHFRK